MTRTLSLLLFALACASAAEASPSGVGRSIDGDSLMVGSQEVRLFGIDAPEYKQSCTRAGKSWACGSAAADQLSKLVAGKQVSCSTVGTDKYGRTVARCSVGATDLNRIMVATGYAVAYRRYSMDYVSAEESAKVAKRGIWSGSFELPSTVRHADDDHMFQPSTPDRSASRALPIVSSVRSKTSSSGGCRIKGNHSRKGERIYHLPGMPYYTETVAEQLFCSEAQARAAGYRRSRADRQR